MQILIVCEGAVRQRWTMPCKEIGKGTTGRAIRAVAPWQEIEDAEGKLQDAGDELCTIDLQHPLDISNLASLNWIITNSGAYDLVLLDRKSLTSLTPIGAYVWVRLLKDTGGLMFMDLKDSRCNGPDIIKGNVRGDNYHLEEVPKIPVLKLLMAPRMSTEDPAWTCYLLKRKIPEDPWPLILRWACKSFNKKLLLYGILSLAPPYVVDMFLKVATRTPLVKGVSPGSQQRSELILKDIGLLGPLVVPPPDCGDMEGLEWTRNSCYMDSSLHCMLAVPSILNHFLLNVNLTPNPPRVTPCGHNPEADLFNRRRLQTELRYITATLRGEATPEQAVRCTDKLRLLMRTCKLEEDRQWWSSRTQDAGEFISWLLDLFPVDQAVTTRTTYATNDDNLNQPLEDMVVSNVFTEVNASPVYSVGQFTLQAQRRELPITHFLTTTDDSGILDKKNLFIVTEGPHDGQQFKRRVAVKTLIRAPGVIIFNVFRGAGGHRKGGAAARVATVSIDPVPEIRLVSGQVFQFSGVVIFQSAHYNCYYRCDDVWYFYDDINMRKSKKIGDYAVMMDVAHHDITERGTVYFYDQVAGPKGLPVPMPKPPLVFEQCEDLEIHECKESKTCDWNTTTGECQAIDDEGQFL